MIAIDLFSGVGGMALGFKQAGFDVIAAFDHERRHTEAYLRNFPDTKVLTTDISTLSRENILDFADHKGEIDVVFGGPPCQGFSLAGKQNVDDERNDLFLTFANLVSELQPKVFVAENVHGILSKKYRPKIIQFNKTLADSGYKISEKPLVLDAQEFGVPQRRRRVFFVGWLDSLGEFPVPESVSSYPHQVGHTYVNVRDAIGDLPSQDELMERLDGDRYLGELGNPSRYAKYLRRARPLYGIPENSVNNREGLGGCALTNHSEKVRDRFTSTPPGAYDSISRFYRLEWDGLSPTLRAGTPRSHGSYMAARPIHPQEPRCITVREAARLHSFPDWFEFCPTKWYGFMQVGNSVPPLLAQAVAKSIKKLLEQS